MQMNLRSRYKFLLLGMAMLALGHNARALSIGDSHELGFLSPGVQRKTDDQNKITYVNHLISMAPGTVDVANGEVYSRSSHGFKSLPVAARTFSGGGRAIDLRHAGGFYTYLFATYKGYGTEVWYVGNLNGVITIPFRAAGQSLIRWTLLGPGSIGVPDGGLTVALLGAALAVIALTRWFLRH